MFFATKVNEYVDKYPGLLEVATSYVSEFAGISRIMYQDDQNILKGFLENELKD